MTLPEPVALWRCGSCENRRGALIVLLHGRGTDEHDLFPLADLMPREAAVAALRGPFPADDGGFGWYVNQTVARPVPASLDASIDYVDRWLREQCGDAEEVWLVGFSAGALMAGALILKAPQRFAGAALLHGPLPFETGVPIVPNRLAGLDVFYGYGTGDDVIPRERIDRTRTYLRDSGARLDEHAYRAAHLLPDDELRDLAAWFSTRFAAPLPTSQETS